jgi:3-oxoacyl-[acyl-carrier-protein] synthase III
MLLGRPTGDARWRVTAAGVEVMADGEPVVGPVGESGADGYQVMLNAKQVRQNYLAGVPRHAESAVAALGGPDRLHRLCLHESNPLLVQQVARQLGVPAGRVPTHSAEVGTLASVSAFTLLGEAVAAPPDGAADGIACSLIGEAGGHLLAGHLCLRRGG